MSGDDNYVKIAFVYESLYTHFMFTTLLSNDNKPVNGP